MRCREPQAVLDYFTLVLANSDYPDNFPQQYRLAYIPESDVLSSLDQRPNLMELTPSEFEALIQNLFGKMGLDTKQTRPARDGGVDCVARTCSTS